MGSTQGIVVSIFAPRFGTGDRVNRHDHHDATDPKSREATVVVIDAIASRGPGSERSHVEDCRNHDSNEMVTSDAAHHVGDSMRRSLQARSFAKAGPRSGARKSTRPQTGLRTAYCRFAANLAPGRPALSAGTLLRRSASSMDRWVRGAGA
jgi:hypothetical protein